MQKHIKPLPRMAPIMEPPVAGSDQSHGVPSAQPLNHQFEPAMPGELAYSDAVAGRARAAAQEAAAPRDFKAGVH